MKRISQFGIAMSALLAAAACASGSGSDTGSTARTSAQTAPASEFSDAQVQTFVTARGEIEPIQRTFASLSAEQRTQASTQITSIMQRNGIDAVTYNNIETRARTDQALANRIAALRVGNFSDAQLRSFVAASLEIDPITRSLTGATPEQQTQATTQIREILTRNNLNSETYNGIAARAQTDQALAARIAQLQTELRGAAPETPETPPEPGQ